MLLDVTSVGICGSDLHYYKDGGIGSDAIASPFVPGHEFAATLAAEDPLLGPAGTLVAVDPGCVCAQCEFCLRGEPNLCSKMRFLGAPPHHGALTEQIVVPRQNIHTVPPGMTPDQVTLLEPLGIAIHAANLAAARPGEDVAVTSTSTSISTISCSFLGLRFTDLRNAPSVGAHRVRLIGAWNPTL